MWRSMRSTSGINGYESGLQPSGLGWVETWGFALGWYVAAPLALNETTLLILRGFK
jgi:hypothetical protein